LFPSVTHMWLGNIIQVSSGKPWVQVDLA